MTPPRQCPINASPRDTPGPGMPGPYRPPYWGSWGRAAPKARVRCIRNSGTFLCYFLLVTKESRSSREAAVPGQRFHHPERYPINRTQKHPKNRLVRHCGQNAHNSSKNMCNFLNKTPLRKGVFFGTIKLCKSVCLELCPEQDWGTCQMTQALCGPDTRTALYAKL